MAAKSKTGPSKRGRPTPTNKKLYNSKVAAAKKKFDVWPSAYASAWVVKEYKKAGGEYSGTTANKVKKA